MTNSGGSVTLTIGSNNASTLFSGLLTAATPANLAVTKVGTGTLTLGSNVETYTGATNVNAGTLNFASGSGLSGVLNVNVGGTLSSTSDTTVPLGGLVLNAGSATTVNLGANSPSTIFNTTNFMAAGASRIDIKGTPAGAGTYALIDYNSAGLTTAQFRNLTMGTLPSGLLWRAEERHQQHRPSTWCSSPGPRSTPSPGRVAAS